MIHYVYIDGKIYLCDVSRFDFGSGFFSKGRHYRAKSPYESFNWKKYSLYVTKINQINEDKIEITFTDPIFTMISTIFTLARGYVNYDYDDHTEEEGDIVVKNFLEDMSPVGWYVMNMINSDGQNNVEYNVIENIEKI
jgi:hypothetical protein